MNNIIGLQHIGIPVNDMDTVLAFYSKLGFEKEYETTNGKERMVFLKKGILVLETYQNGCASLRNGAWDHVALDVLDIEETWKEVVEGLGIPSLEGSIQFLPFWKNGVRFFTIVGPSMEKIEFSQKL